MKTAWQALIRMTMAGALASLLVAGCGDDSNAADAGPDIDAIPDSGTVSLTWSIANAGAPLTCAEVGGLNVRISATPQAGGTGFPEAFGCDLGSGTSTPIDSGIYNIEIELVASGNQPLTASQLFPGVTISQGQNVPLGDIVFEVVPAGNVEFTIDTQAVGGNCDPVANGGAELSEFRIDYMDVGGQCVVTTFEVADGANQAGFTYVSDCGIARAVCIQDDQVVRAVDVPSGTGSMNIVGYRGPDECYSRMPLFSVPGSGLTTTLSPQVLAPVGVCAAP